jgi:ATP-binding protein involved in chromosome partitioning
VNAPARRVLAVASGKGGVGKSTLTLNLALALAKDGAQVGVLDADLYGPDIPLMVGLKRTERANELRLWRLGRPISLPPVEVHGLRLMSIGFLLGEDQAIALPGMSVELILRQLVTETDWGELDYLVIDLPPGTGDVQLTLTQQVPITGGVIVTTPQDVALADVRRGIAMFRQVDAPVLGVIENMSYHLCPGCGARAELFAHGGGAAMAREAGIPFLGEVPLVRAIREAGDAGTPIVAAEPSHPQSRAFFAIAERVLMRLDEARRATGAPLPVVAS